MTSIVLNFTESQGNPVSLIGTNFTVTPLNWVTATTPAVYEDVTTSTRWGKSETKKVLIKEAETFQKPFNGLTIKGGATVSGYNNSYQASYTAPDISFADYAKALTKASTEQEGRPLVVINLAAIQQANVAKLG